MTTQTLTTENISQSAVEALSRSKGEPSWMLDLRLKAWRFFEEMPWPTGKEETWRRTRLTGFNLDEYQPLTGAGLSGDVPADVQKTLNEIDSVGHIAFVDAAVVERRLDAALEAKGVIFTDLDTAVREHPELVQKYYGSVVATDENKFSALHYALWNSGAFVYVPRNVAIERPLQTVIAQREGKYAGLHHTIVATDRVRR